MILDALSPDAGMLLVVGASGGLIRGMVSLRKAAAAGPISGAAAPVLLIDIGTSIIIGAAASLFLHGVMSTLFGPALDFINTDESGKLGTSGFLAGLVGVTAIGWLIDTANIRAKLKTDAASQPDPPQGGKT